MDKNMGVKYIKTRKIPYKIKEKILWSLKMILKMIVYL